MAGNREMGEAPGYLDQVGDFVTISLAGAGTALHRTTHRPRSRTIAAQLNAEGLVARTGVPWRTGTVWRILKRAIGASWSISPAPLGCLVDVEGTPRADETMLEPLNHKEK